uniref:Actin related protein 10 n=1 Tax=Mastacembelus armatus TaxID=205130 RepID=A0A7N8XK00_9TELE
MPLFDGLGSGGEKTAIVIDLGAAYTKCGFAGETGPRFIIPSEIQKPGQQQAIKVVQYNINTEELYVILKEFIHILYFRHLLVNPRDRRVVIIESILCPSHFRETLTKVFFKQFEVPSVLFAPSHLMAIMTLGINSALVMDCGYTETLVLPVSFSEVLTSPLRSSSHSTDKWTLEYKPLPCGCFKPKMYEYGLVLFPAVRTCFVSDLQRGFKIQEAKFNLDGTAERPAPPPDVDYPLDGEKILHVKGPIRDSVMEMLFEQDNEEKSVASLILDALVKCPIDTRKVLSENLVVIGGTAMLPGFLHRLLAEIRLLVEKPKYSNVLASKNFRIHAPPAKPNCTAWLGGAIFGALQDILGSRSVSRDYYNQTGRIPDWCCLSSPPPESLYEAGKTPPPLMKRAFSTEK